MQYETKVLILKQIEEGFSSGSPVGGILRIETESDVSTIFLSLINTISVSGGNYVLFLTDGNGKKFAFDLPKKPTTFRKTLNIPFITDKMQVGLCFVKDTPIIVAFSSSEDGGGIKEFTKSINEYYKNLKKKTRQEIYNDEAVATENYFDYEREIEEKIEEIKETEYDLFNENIKSRSEFKEEKEKGRTGTFTNHYEADFIKGKIRYFDKVKEELLSVLKSNPKESLLENSFKGSSFSKVYYSEDKYYVVGIIFENEKEKYICYGVPEKFSEYAPKELEGYCSFIPLSIFDMKGLGYWMMFQDADTGECIKRK